MSPTKANFRTVVTSLSKGEVLIPLIRSYLDDPAFPEFRVTVKRFINRPPDGWFHPSTHPTWPERMLYYYLMHPEEFIGEPYDPLSALTVTQGQFWHSFMETCRLDCGYLTAANVPVADADAGSRGEMDGASRDGEVYELKTMREPKARKIAKGNPDDPEVLASFRQLVPGYYAQGQEYMRLSGLKRWRLLIISLEWPFPMREISMRYEPAVAERVRQKYLNVRQAVEDERPPQPCCGPGSKEAQVCPARAVCPVGRRSL